MTAIDSHRAFSLAHHPRSLSPWPRYSEPVFNFSKASNFKERNTIWQRSHHWFIRFKSIQNEDLLKGHGGNTQNRSCVGTIYLFKTSWLGMRSPKQVATACNTCCHKHPFRDFRHGPCCNKREILRTEPWTFPQLRRIQTMDAVMTFDGHTEILWHRENHANHWRNCVFDVTCNFDSYDLSRLWWSCCAMLCSNLSTRCLEIPWVSSLWSLLRCQGWRSWWLETRVFWMNVQEIIWWI